ncbi:hypothetical protein F9C07_956 [Aspergillus flavus]|uniref:Uncharacterized protein n=1 Tax=Aspergillus flavus (strain ATCC 200026 / FGSC A1120 / IAM 13836 / NRRL 3357 / JCM 12722 / SRRC 167) TaxID=332952 RepID=A0A7U2QX21_ASPFN|nr:hypothetical protein F9C07_956 [Aspergillus flavus]
MARWTGNKFVWIQAKGRAATTPSEIYMAASGVQGSDKLNLSMDVEFPNNGKMIKFVEL